MKPKNGERIVNIIINIMLIAVAALCLYPIWYVLIASVSSPHAIGSGEVILWPKGFNWDGYRKLINNKNIWIGYRNSILYTVV